MALVTVGLLFAVVAAHYHRSQLQIRLGYTRFDKTYHPQLYEPV